MQFKQWQNRFSFKALIVLAFTALLVSLLAPPSRPLTMVAWRRWMTRK